MRKYPTDYWLWGALALTFAVAWSLGEYWVEPNYCWALATWAWVRAGCPHFAVAGPFWVALVLGHLVAFAMVGWSGQALLRGCAGGARRRLGPQAADYDDAPPAP